CTVTSGLDDDVAAEAEMIAKGEELVLGGITRCVLALGGIGELGSRTEDVTVRIDGAVGQDELRLGRSLVPVQPAWGLLEDRGGGLRCGGLRCGRRHRCSGLLSAVVVCTNLPIGRFVHTCGIAFMFTPPWPTCRSGPPSRAARAWSTGRAR